MAESSLNMLELSRKVRESHGIPKFTEDLGTASPIPPNPDYVCTLYSPDIDLEPGDNDHEIAKAEQAGRSLTRLIMKAHGLLISVSEAAALLGTSTQNVSGYIAKRRLRSWPDPEDNRRQLVLRSEVEAR